MFPFDDPEIYHRILESIPTGLCVLNVQKKILLWSDGAERITGRRRHEVMGHSCVGEPLLHCDHQDCEWCADDCPAGRAMKTSHPIEILSFVRHKEGHELPVRAYAVPVRDGRGLIIGAIEIFAEQPTSASERRQDSAQAPGSVDELTGLASRAMMQVHLRRVLETFAEMQVPFAVLCFRLEGLDQFRANFGPDAASSLLRVIARTLQGALWKTDSVGRWSDGEFLAVLNGCRPEALQPVRERFRRMLAGEGIEWWGEKRSLPISIGQASVQPGDSTETMIRRVQESQLSAARGLVSEARRQASAGS
jgi:diguanylate cyclase (GGDEF)-like protein/PAS domain S-box-containing protein